MSQEFDFTLPSGAKFGPVAAKENTRYALGGVAVLPAHESPQGKPQAAIVATDGRGLAVGLAPCNVAPTKPYLLPAKAATGKGLVSVNGSITERRGSDTAAFVALPQEGLYPMVSDVLPPVESLAGRLHVRLDAALLARVAAAVSSENIVTLAIETDATRFGRGIIVIGDESRAGLVMPCGSGKDNAQWKIDHDTYREVRGALGPCGHSIRFGEVAAPTPIAPAPAPVAVPAQKRRAKAPAVVAPVPAPAPWSQPGPPRRFGR